MDFFNNFLKGDNDQILFFILVFLFLFNGNALGFGKNCDDPDHHDDNTILFFIIIFLLLFFCNKKDTCDTFIS